MLGQNSSRSSSMLCFEAAEPHSFGQAEQLRAATCTS